MESASDVQVPVGTLSAGARRLNSDLDPASLLRDIVADVVADLLVKAGRATIGTVRSESVPAAPDESIARAAQQATSSLLAVERVAPELGGEGLRSVLGSEEMLELLRRCFVWSTVDSQHDQPRFLVDECAAVLRARLRLTEGQSQTAATHLLRALVLQTESALKSAVEGGSLASHEVLSSARQVAVMDELGDIKESLRVAFEPGPEAVDQQEKWAHDYTAELSQRLGSLVPPNVDDRTAAVPFEDLYVDPVLSKVGSLTGLLEELHRVVVLGAPGSGKSTLTHAIALRLASREERTVRALGDRIPFRVILRSFSRFRDERTILEHLAREASLIAQQTFTTEQLDSLLRRGRGVVIFDGLDEIFDRNQRRDIVSDVEAFGRQYQNSLIVVTSRSVGYEQAPLTHSWGAPITLEGFDDDRIRAYVDTWIGRDPVVDDEPIGERVERLLASLDEVRDLASEPLMLALICSASRYGRRDIPRNRPAVYEECADLLYRRWDDDRQLRSPLPFEQHLRPALDHLAHWIYGDLVREAGVSETQLVDAVVEYLHPKHFRDREESRRAARSFCRFCAGRAWVFTETGLNEDGEALYEFSHRTFLEYFAARYQARHARTPAAFAHRVAPDVLAGRSQLVSHIALRLLEDSREGAADEVLSVLLETAAEADEESAMELERYCARALGLVVPAQDVVQGIVDRVVNHLGRADAGLVINVLADLTRVGAEVRPVVVQALARRVGEAVSGEDEFSARGELVLHVLASIDKIAEVPGRPAVPPRAHRLMWQQTRAGALVEQTGLFKRLVRTSVRAAVLASLASELDPELAFPAYHAIDEYFMPVELDPTGGLRLPSVAESLYRFDGTMPGTPGIGTEYERAVRAARVEVLAALPEAWAERATPWFLRGLRTGYDYRFASRSPGDIQAIVESPAALLGVSMLALPRLEEDRDTGATRRMRWDTFVREQLSQPNDGWLDAAPEVGRTFVSSWLAVETSLTPPVGHRA